ALMASCRPLRCCWPSTAGGPDSVVISPIFSLSCAAATVVAKLHRPTARSTQTLAMDTLPRKERGYGARLARRHPGESRDFPFRIQSFGEFTLRGPSCKVAANPFTPERGAFSE